MGCSVDILWRSDAPQLGHERCKIGFMQRPLSDGAWRRGGSCCPGRVWKTLAAILIKNPEARWQSGIIVCDWFMLAIISSRGAHCENCRLALGMSEYAQCFVGRSKAAKACSNFETYRRAMSGGGTIGGRIHSTPPARPTLVYTDYLENRNSLRTGYQPMRFRGRWGRLGLRK